jgi:hypothetical protein
MHTQAGDYISPETLGPYTDFEVPNWPHELVGSFHTYINIHATCIQTYMHACMHTQAGDYISPETLGPYTDFEVPNWPHELVGGFLAILIVFRTNQAYERYVYMCVCMCMLVYMCL